jgi:eukaryotic-like serine/threonine-protein kinase
LPHLIFHLNVIGQYTRRSCSERPANRLAKLNPEDTVEQYAYLPEIRAELALAQGTPARSIEELLPTVPYELAVTDSGLLPVMYSVYLRGQASLAAKNPAAAILEFRKILDHPGIVFNESMAVLAHLGLARAYVLQGDTGRAQTAFQDFLTLWKDADPDIPVFQQAKAEYAKLQ